MFYDVYCQLCKENGLSPSGAASKIGFNRSSITVWKNSGNPPKPELLNKIATYFGVSTDYLLGKEAPSLQQSRETSDEDIKFALFGGDGEITDEMYDEVKAFAQFVKQKHSKKEK